MRCARWKRFPPFPLGALVHLLVCQVDMEKEMKDKKLDHVFPPDAWPPVNAVCASSLVFCLAVRVSIL